MPFKSWLPKLYDAWVLLLLASFLLLGTFWGVTSRVHLLLLVTGLLLLPHWKALFQQLQHFRWWLLGGSLLLLLAFIPSYLNAEDVPEFYRRLERYYRYGLLLPVMFALLHLRTRMQPLVLLLSLLLPFLMLLYWYVQKELNGVDIWFHTRNPLFIDQYHKIAAAETLMSIGIIMLVHGCLRLAQGKFALLSWISFVLSIACVIIISTRGVLIGIPLTLSLALLLAFYQRPGFKLLSKIMLAGFIAASLLTAGVAVWQKDRLIAIKEHYVDHKNYEEASVGARFMMWQSALRAWPEHPWIGAGAGDWMRVWIEQRDIFNQSLSKPETRVFGHAHSNYFDALLTGGVLGLSGLLLSLIIIPGVMFWRWFIQAQSEAERFFALSGVTLVLAYAVYGLTEAWYSRAVMISGYTLLMAIMAAGYLQEKQRRVSDSA